MPKSKLCALLITFFVLAGFDTACGQSQVDSVHSLTTPPPIRREFRGVWVASVENIDWPSQPGLSTQSRSVVVTMFWQLPGESGRHQLLLTAQIGKNI